MINEDCLPVLINYGVYVSTDPDSTGGPGLVCFLEKRLLHGNRQMNRDNT